jgi:hypothetical protein
MALLPFTLVSTATPIVPIMIGDEAAADRFAALLTAERIHVDAVKFPAVPMHKARLRVQLNAGHTRAQIDHLVDILTENQDLVGGEKSHAPVFASTSAAFNHGVARPWAIAARSYAERAALAAFTGLRDTAAAAVASISSLAKQRLPSLGLSLNVVTLATAALVAIDLYFDIPHLIFAYLLPILFVAVKFGRTPALLAIGLSAFCSAYFFYEPQFSFRIDDSQDAAELASFCVIAVLASYFLGAPARAFAVRRL